MEAIKLNEKISVLRKRKGITQEELAQVLGVTNQTVSKWESSVCCPDIQLLPELASFFEVSIDELMGYEPVRRVDDIIFRIRELFKDSAGNEAFSTAYKIASLLHEGICTKGYSESVPWNTERTLAEQYSCSNWGVSICSEPEGITVHKANAVFLSDNQYLRNDRDSFEKVFEVLKNLIDKNTLNVLFQLYELTVVDFEKYVKIDALAEQCRLGEDEVGEALKHIPVQIKVEENGNAIYRMEGKYMHIPALLHMFIVY